MENYICRELRCVVSAEKELFCADALLTKLRRGVFAQKALKETQVWCVPAETTFSNSIWMENDVLRELRMGVCEIYMYVCLLCPLSLCSTLCSTHCVYTPLCVFPHTLRKWLYYTYIYISHTPILSSLRKGIL